MHHSGCFSFVACAGRRGWGRLGLCGRGRLAAARFTLSPCLLLEEKHPPSFLIHLRFYQQGNAWSSFPANPSSSDRDEGAGSGWKHLPIFPSFSDHLLSLENPNCCGLVRCACFAACLQGRAPALLASSSRVRCQSLSFGQQREAPGFSGLKIQQQRVKFALRHTPEASGEGEGKERTPQCCFSQKRHCLRAPVTQSHKGEGSLACNCCSLGA